MRCPTCGCRRVFDSFFVQVYQCGYAVDVSTDTIIQKCGGDVQGEPTKPRCETCPLWVQTAAAPKVGTCALSSVPTDGSNVGAGWFCDKHPGYRTWAKVEYKRRLRETGGAK
jgi:hypothetical protein